MENKEHRWKKSFHKEIYERIKSYRERLGTDWRDDFFNNFRMLMPSRGEFCWRFDKKYLDKHYLSFDWSQANKKLGYRRYSSLLGG